MKSKNLQKSFYLLIVVGIIISFQNCSSNFVALSEDGSLGSAAGMQLSAESFRVGKDTELEQLQQDCPEPGYRNFKCVSKILRTQEGLDYPVTFRWNRVGQESSGTVIWVLGNNGRGKWREFPDTIPVQEDFDRNKKIRSVEIDFSQAPKISINDGGYWTHGGGYYSSAQAYMAAVAYVTANLKSGAFLNHVGGSNGTMVAAYSLSHFGAGEYVDRFIFHAGPFLPSLPEACDTTHFASFSISPRVFGTIKSFLGIWAALDPNIDVCASSSAPAINRLSLLKDAVKSYPKNGIHVVMGAKEKDEGFGEWILESNLSWYSQIEAAEKTREVLTTIGHEMYWPAVANFASRPKPAPMGAAPTLTFSTTRDGAAVTRVPASATVYGVIRNIDASSAMGCMAESSRAADCANPHKWASLPNGDWTFDGSVWRSQFSPKQVGIVPGKTYVGFNINMKTGQRTPAVHLEVTADTSEPRGTEPPAGQGPTPVLILSKSYNGGSSGSFAADETVYGVSRNLPAQGVKGCMQESSQFSLCSDPKNWQSLPNGDWNYVNGEWRAQFIPSQRGGMAGKTYIGFQVNTATGARTANFSFSVTAPSRTPAPAPSVPAISEGLFMTDIGIYYSNGSSYCHFGNMESFTKATGRTNADGIRRVNSLPASMRNDGTCAVP